MKINAFAVAFFLLLNCTSFSQIPENEFYFMFYNVENLFDTKDDPDTSDEEFTPGGIRHWTYKRMNKKLVSISKVVLNAAGWQTPDLIGLCEIENRYVLEKLIKDTPLNAFPYNIIHKESPDSRGIDVALIYNSAKFYPLEYSCIPLKTSEGTILNTREILYVTGILAETDTLHIYINHWPSRYSGLLESAQPRQLAAQTLRTCIASVQASHRDPKIIVAGDFNDQPSDESLSKYLEAEEPGGIVENNRLYNLSWAWTKKDVKTLKHQTQWSVFDQIIVSGSLLSSAQNLFTEYRWAQIADLPFLLEKDLRNGGMKLNRTYVGYRYHGGFSDHLPVVLKLRNDPEQE